MGVECNLEPGVLLFPSNAGRIGHYYRADDRRGGLFIPLWRSYEMEITPGSAVFPVADYSDIIKRLYSLSELAENSILTLIIKSLIIDNYYSRSSLMREVFLVSFIKRYTMSEMAIHPVTYQ